MIAAEVARRAVARAGDEALASVTRERSLLLRFASNRPTQATAIDDVTVELALLRHGHVGRATTNAVDDESLAACARRSGAAAAEMATNWTWERAAEKIAARLHALGG